MLKQVNDSEEIVIEISNVYSIITLIFPGALLGCNSFFNVDLVAVRWFHRGRVQVTCFSNLQKVSIETIENQCFSNCFENYGLKEILGKFLKCWQRFNARIDT